MIKRRDTRGNEQRITPAALGALMRGDTENFNIANTPGGIEKQEAEGQKKMCSEQDRLPKTTKNFKDSAKCLKKLNIPFVPIDGDDLWYLVTLPDGWKIEPTEHSMWSKLINDKGEEMASIFYKAAFYDKSCHIKLKED